MAIFFHEGLPRSGKSFEALVKHIVPALQAGRHVYAYIEGLDFTRIAEVCGMPIGAIKALLHPVAKEQVKEIHKLVAKDSFVVIDEVQDFFPSDRKPLPEDVTTFVTQHGHEGLDILLMGQDHRDCHSLWKRRIQNLVTFMKLDAVGMEQRYKWTMHRYNGKKYVPISSGIEKYDSKYFGCYASHSEGTSNTGNYKDKRAVVWNKPGIKYGVPAMFAVAIWAVWNLWAFFHPVPVEAAAVKVAPQSAAQAAPESFEARRARRAAEKESAASVAAEKPLAPVLAPEIQYVLDMQQQNRLRLSGIVVGANGRVTGFVDAVDSTFHVKERFLFSDLQAMGWQVDVQPYGVRLHREGYAFVVRAWAIDPVGFTPNAIMKSGDFKPATSAELAE